MASGKFDNKSKGKPNHKTVHGVPTSRLDAPEWQATVGTYISGREELDDLDMLAIEMEAKWGADRLRLLVDKELREKFDRQRYLVNQAIWHGDLESVRREARRMMAAWRVLDKAADAAGKPARPPEVWEAVTPRGTVVAVVRSDADARLVDPAGRKARVYTMEEIARLIEEFPAIAKVKDAYPGATVTRVGTYVADPLDGVADSIAPIDGTVFDDDPPW